jgi:hypothetical protein
MVAVIGAPEARQFMAIELVSRLSVCDRDDGRGRSLEVGAQSIAVIAGITRGRAVANLRARERPEHQTEVAYGTTRAGQPCRRRQRPPADAHARSSRFRRRL